MEDNWLITSPAEDEPFLMLIKVEALREHFDPLIFDTWGFGPLSRDNVLKFANSNRVQKDPFDPKKWNDFDLKYHEQRVAYFVNYGIVDPIEIEIIDQSIAINDGHHRLAAAIILNLEHIPAFVGGFIDDGFSINLYG